MGSMWYDNDSSTHSSSGGGRHGGGGRRIGSTAVSRRAHYANYSASSMDDISDIF